jgi:hypothetical protein
MKLIEKFQIVDILNQYTTKKINFKELCGLIFDKHYEVHSFNRINKHMIVVEVNSTITNKTYQITS